jgi:two-component system, LytTR family, response regulator LytT
MKIVIIEDEILTAEDLRHDLQSLNYGIEVTVILPTVSQSIEYFSTNVDYNLIFSDIQLGDGYSFEIFKKVSVNSPIIFCTAYNQYALEAFENNGIDYILKPFDKISIAHSLEKYRLLKEKFSTPQIDYSNLSASLLPKVTKIQSLLVHQGDKILPIPVVNIGLLQLKNQVVQLYTLEGSQFPVFQSLEELENKLPSEFYRINRQFIVNRKAIKDVSRHFGRKLLINLTLPFSEPLIVGKERTTHFMEWLSEN